MMRAQTTDRAKAVLGYLVADTQRPGSTYRFNFYTADGREAEIRAEDGTRFRVHVLEVIE